MRERDDTGRIVEGVSVGSTGAVVVLRGEIDVVTVDQLRDCLDRLLADPPATLTVDMESVTFLDSTGLGVLVDAANRIQSGRLTIANPSNTVSKLVELTGLGDLLRLSDAR